jgi:hypothetical protein
MRANGFHYDAVKIFCDKNGRVTKVPYREYVIPDVTAGIFWLKNRDPEHWRDSQRLEVFVCCICNKQSLTPLGVVAATRRGGSLFPKQWGMVIGAFVSSDGPSGQRSGFLPRALWTTQR